MYSYIQYVTSVPPLKNRNRRALLLPSFVWFTSLPSKPISNTSYTMANNVPITVSNSEGEFQVHTSTKNTNNKRVYIGALPPNHPNLKEELEAFLSREFPQISINSITIIDRGKAPHALVDCGDQANTLISKLNNQEWNDKRLVVQREKRQKGNKNNSNTNFNNNNMKQQVKKGFKGWSKPKSITPIPIEEATENIGSVISKEIQQAEEKGEDTINVALASTAAVTMLVSMNAFSAYDNDNDNSLEDENGASSEQSSFQIKDMSELLADFGQQDLNWKKMQIAKEETTEPTESRLAARGKAPIHIVLSSFGFKNGAPPRPEGWSQSEPLTPLDIRKLFEPVPKYLEWRDGLSGAVKHALRQGENDINMQDYSKETVAKQAWDELISAQNSGGYGYAAPLTMTIYIGSELGRHRSVVICEWAAIQVRQWLRQNANNQILQPVSVGTFHRDVEKQRKAKKAATNRQQQSKKSAVFGDDW